MLRGTECLDDAKLKQICQNLCEDVRIALAISLPKIEMDEKKLELLANCDVESAATVENACEFLSVGNMMRFFLN